MLLVVDLDATDNFSITSSTCISLQCDLVGQLADEDIKAFTKLADSCADGQWICTSAKTGFNVQDALSMIMELV